MQSLILDKINALIAKPQAFLSTWLNNSVIIKNLDEITFTLVTLLLILSTFCETNILGTVAIATIFVSIIKLFVSRGEKIEISNADGALIIFFLFLVFSTLNSTEPGFSLEGFVKYAVYIGYYFSIMPMLRKRKRKVLLIVLLIGGLCTLEAFYALLQSKTVIAGATWQDMSYINPEDAISRIYGSLKPYNPNLLAGYLTACVPAVIGITLLTIEKRHRKSFFIALSAVIISLLAIFQTGCRGSYIALIAIFLGLILISYRIVFHDFAAFNRFKKLWVNFTSGLLGGGILALMCMPKILHRLMSVFLLRGDSSTSFRMNVYQASWHMFTDNPLFGIGPGNHTFREIYGYYMLTGFDALAAYSVPLEIAVETGIFGFLSFFSFIGILFWSSAKYIFQDQSIRGKIYVSISILSILGMMVHGLFDTVFFRPQVQFIFWTMVALLNGVISRKEIYTKDKIECR